MRRREFIATLGAATAWPLRLQAQQRALPVVGLVFTPGSLDRMLGPTPASLPARAFLHRMRDLGWVDGQTITIERRIAQTDPQRLATQFAELRKAGSKVNVLAGARGLQDAALQAGTPVITLFHEDPVTAGLVKSLARPGGNVTGITTTTGPELYSKRLQFLAEIAPGRNRLALLGPREQLVHLDAIERPPGVWIIPVPVEIAEDYENAFTSILQQNIDGLIAGTGPLTYGNAKRIAKFALEHRLPAIFAIREAVEDGGLISYGPSIPGAFRQTAGMVDRFLKGEPLGEMPIERPTLYELVINAATARALTLTVPSTLLMLADEVIE